MSRVSSTAKALSVTLALSLAGAGAAQAASTAQDAATERQLRANLAANPGSVRTGPNQIQLERGGDHDAARPGPSRRANRHEFCIYEDVNFRQARFDMVECKNFILRDYRFIDKHGRSDRGENEASSWVNNQTGGAVATLNSKADGKGTWFRSSGRKANRVGPKWNDNIESILPC